MSRVHFKVAYVKSDSFIILSFNGFANLRSSTKRNNLGLPWALSDNHTCSYIVTNSASIAG